MIKAQGFSPAQLSRFRDLQRQSFDLLERVAGRLVGGETEKEVGRELVREYRKLGAESFFHLPVVLFGERTALPGEWSVGKFFPRRRALQAGDSVILDAAPVIGGYLVDTSYSLCFGECTRHRAMMRHLSRFRHEVLAAINQGDSFASIARAVDGAIQSAGYESVHRKHPGEVLGHRAVKLPRLPVNLRFRGFDAVALGWFRAKHAWAASGLGRRSPLWNARTTSEHGPHEGLWLVEPHAGSGAVGAKWEEILVIEAGRARWLEEAPPHLRQWARIEQGAAYGPGCSAAADVAAPN